MAEAQPVTQVSSLGSEPNALEQKSVPPVNVNDSAGEDKTPTENLVTKEKPKASQKINIPFDEHLYKDLIELQVTEKDIYAEQAVTAARTKDSAKPRDNEPCLIDFYTPDFSHEFVISPPEVHLEVEKKRFFDGFGVTQYLDKF